MKTSEDNLRDLWNNIKHMNIRIIWVSEGEERKKGPEEIFEEIKDENFPNMGKEIVNHIQKAQSPRWGKPKEEHIKLTKIEDKEKY